VRIYANLSYGNKIRGVGAMGQFGFFDADRRLAAISAKGDPLEMIARVVRNSSSFNTRSRGRS
jgi:hypothetical protein